ncbi:MAG: peptidase M15A [Alphaproteobacteria bacterium]|nr:MAG: peptidase M15A [Alphaproteobacteria bacterium]
MQQKQLTQHFTLNELTHSSLALRHGLPNQAGVGEVANLTRLARHILEPVRVHFARPFRPSSGFRSLAVNRQLGSKDSSQHITGQAADFELASIPNRLLADWIRDSLVFDQLILEFYHSDEPASGWVHCSYSKDNNRQQSLIFDGTTYREF